MTDNRLFKPFWSLAITWLVILAVFWIFPSIDIGISRLFFLPKACRFDAGIEVCGMFPIGELPIMIFVRSVLFYLPAIVAVALVASFVPQIDRRLTWPEISRKNRAIALGVWIFDVGLIVNVLLKGYSGRPRPADTTIFSGHLPFVPAGSFSGACTSNCSFISGEAASAGWIFCLLALCSPQLRQMLFKPVLIVSVLTALLRVFFGRHFLSDAVLAWLSAVIVFELAAVIFKWDERATTA